MIHHISIAADYPEHVAQVLAEILQGLALPFPEHPGSYLALALDTYGTLIEVHPQGTELVPGQIVAPCQEMINADPSPYNATHAALSVAISETQIRAIAAREGWQVARFDRAGCFEVIELWLENRQLIELLPPELASRYLTFMHPENLERFFAESTVVSH